MAGMCKGRKWDSVRIPDNNPTQINDGTITIEEEDTATKKVKGKHAGSTGNHTITGTCDHGNPRRSEVRLERPEGSTTIRYSGQLLEGSDDISGGRYRVIGGQVDPDEGTWVATGTGGDSEGPKDEKDKKDKDNYASKG